MSDDKPSIRDVALRHARAGGTDRRTMHVPEWDAPVFATGFISVAENHRYHRLSSKADDASGELAVNVTEVMARAVIDKLEDEDGAPVFRDEDLDVLLNRFPADLVSQLYAFVRGEADLSPKRFRVTVG